MAVKPVAVVVLVCPQCGKKYKGDASKPDARYQCPVDQSTLIRLDTEAATAARQARSSSSANESPAPAPENGIAAGADVASPDGEAAASPTPGYSPAYGSDGDDSQEIAPSPPPPPRPAAAPPRPAPPTSAPPAGASILSGFEQRQSVVAALEKFGHTDPVTGEWVPVYKYEIKSKLGQGGMGEVYKVLDRDLRREVAMKRLRPQAAMGAAEEDLLRFVKEAQATGRLEHPNIVPVHDLGVDGDGRVYFTLKYVKGLSLKEVIRGRRDATQLEDKRKFRDVFTPRQMIEILISVCNAVAYAHSKDIIHRDLKPDNIMLGNFGEVLVMDWGLAKILGKKGTQEVPQESSFDFNLRANLDSSMTMEGAIAGTPAYMSPEQAGGRISELDFRTDIYSLGAMLYEILAGEPPYKGTTALEVVRMVTEGPPAPLASGTYGFRPIPRELQAICEKAMAHQAGQRYAGAEQMRDDLTAYLEDQPVSCCPDTVIQRSVKWVKRNRYRVTASAITAVGIFAIIFAGWVTYRQITVHGLLTRASHEATIGKDRYEASKAHRVATTDPNQLQLQASAQAELASIYREHLNAGIDLARKALDISPGNTRAHTFLADSYMQLWRLELTEGNEDLMKVYGGEVLRYAPDPDQYRHELEGFGRLTLVVEPPDANVYLFRFETLHSNDAQGNVLPSRLVPVPYDPVARESDADFLAAEGRRASSGGGIAPDAHSIYKLDPTAPSRIGSGGTLSVEGLPPGSYMLLLLALNRQETRVPFNMERDGQITRHIVMPKIGDVPDGFVYVEGGPAWLGGTSANALPRGVKQIAPFVIYHDEISMGDYAQFLKAIGGEAKARMPRDSGKLLATLGPNGLVPADGSDAQKFAQSAARGISYNDAQAYADWRSKHDGIAYRLPTEYEWEAACRGVDGRRFSWGNVAGRGEAITLQGPNDTGNNMSWNWQDYKDESPWGVHDLAGGVAEWTSSTYKEAAPANDPLYGQHTIKGDAWSLAPDGLECAFRTSGQPDYVHNTVGFRIAADWPVKHTGEPQAQKDEGLSQPPPAQASDMPKPKPQKKMTHAEEVIHKLGLDK